MILLTLLFTNCSRNASTPTPVQATATVTQTQTAIRIGIAIDQTGKDNAPGSDQQIGADLAEKYFKSYLCDNPSAEHNFCLNFVYRDTRSDNETAAEAFKTLIYTDNVTLIIGPTYSEQAFHVYPEAEKAGVPVIGPSTTADGIPQLGNYISRVSAPVAIYTAFAVTTVATDTQRVAIVYQDDDRFTLSETQTFSQAVQANHLDLAFIESYPAGTSDFSPLVNKILSANPDLVIISTRFKDGVRFVKQLQQANYTGKLIGGNAFNANAIFDACQEACNGIYIAQAYNAQQADLPINQAFVQLYQNANYGSVPSQISAQMFTAIQVVVQSLDTLTQQRAVKAMQLGELRTALNQQLLSRMNLETPLGKIWFDQEGEVCQSQFYVMQITNSNSASKQVKIIEMIALPLKNVDQIKCYPSIQG